VLERAIDCRRLLGPSLQAVTDGLLSGGSHASVNSLGGRARKQTLVAFRQTKPMAR
jgi:hypothetical protein